MATSTSMTRWSTSTRIGTTTGITSTTTIPPPLESTATDTGMKHYDTDMPTCRMPTTAIDTDL